MKGGEGGEAKTLIFILALQTPYKSEKFKIPKVQVC